MDGMLRGWKAIATHCQMSEAAVRRWEKSEGLPVHRQPHAKGASVYAYRDEIDAWLEARSVSPSQPPAAPVPPASSLPVSSPVSFNRRHFLIGGATLAIAAGAVAWSKRERTLRHHKVATAGGFSSISPDGESLVIERNDHLLRLDLRTGQEKPLRPGEYPRWSPDGKAVAFLVWKKDHYSLQVADLATDRQTECVERCGFCFDWMPDSRGFALCMQAHPDLPTSVYLARRSDGAMQRVTQPPAGYWGDILVAVSPQADRLALARYRERGKGSIYVSAIDGSDLRRLAVVDNWIHGVTFTPDGRELFFGSVTEQGAVLWRVPVDGSRPHRPVRGAPETAAEPQFALERPDRFVFSTHYWLGHSWSSSLRDGQGRELYPGVSLEGPRVSRNAAWLAAQASTPPKLRIVAADGSGQRAAFAVTAPAEFAWSPDDRWVAFGAEIAPGRRAIHVAAADGSGVPLRLTTEAANERRPCFSADGKAVYFTSDRDGGASIYRAPWPVTGAAPRLIAPRGVEAKAIPDGRHLVLLLDEEVCPFHLLPVEGGPLRVLPGSPTVRPGHWEVTRDGIWYTALVNNVFTLGVLRSGAARVETVPHAALQAVDDSSLNGFSVDWTGERLFWSFGTVEHAVHIGEGY